MDWLQRDREGKWTHLNGMEGIKGLDIMGQSGSYCERIKRLGCYGTEKTIGLVIAGQRGLKDQLNGNRADKQTGYNGTKMVN